MDTSWIVVIGLICVIVGSGITFPLAWNLGWRRCEQALIREPKAQVVADSGEPPVNTPSVSADATDAAPAVVTRVGYKRARTFGE
jgi:hypothetical protein